MPLVNVGCQMNCQIKFEGIQTSRFALFVSGFVAVFEYKIHRFELINIFIHEAYLLVITEAMAYLISLSMATLVSRIMPRRAFIMSSLYCCQCAWLPSFEDNISSEKISAKIIRRISQMVF